MKPTDFRLVGILSVASFFVLAEAGSQTVYDDFATKWRPFSFGSGTTTEFVRDRVEISVDAAASGDGPDFFGRGLYSTCEVSGDFDLRASFQLLAWPQGNGVRVALHLGTLAGIRNRGVYLERDSYGEAEDGPLEVYVYYADEGQTLIEHETTDQSGFFRLVRVGSNLTGYYLSDSGWTELGSSDVGTENQRFALFVYSHDSVFADSDVKAAFNGVRVASGTLTGDRCPFTTP
jgi:hypothetical protein